MGFSRFGVGVTGVVFGIGVFEVRGFVVPGFMVLSSCSGFCGSRFGVSSSVAGFWFFEVPGFRYAVSRFEVVGFRVSRSWVSSSGFGVSS